MSITRVQIYQGEDNNQDIVASKDIRLEKGGQLYLFLWSDNIFDLTDRERGFVFALEEAMKRFEAGDDFDYTEPTKSSPTVPQLIPDSREDIELSPALWEQIDVIRREQHSTRSKVVGQLCTVAIKFLEKRAAP